MMFTDKLNKDSLEMCDRKSFDEGTFEIFFERQKQKERKEKLKREDSFEEFLKWKENKDTYFDEKQKKEFCDFFEWKATKCISQATDIKSISDSADSEDSFEDSYEKFVDWKKMKKRGLHHYSISDEVFALLENINTRNPIKGIEHLPDDVGIW